MLIALVSVREMLDTCSNTRKQVSITALEERRTVALTVVTSYIE